MKSRIAALLVALLCLLAAAPVPAEEAPPSPFTLYFFHDTACASCDGTEEFLALFSQELVGVMDRVPYELKMYNVFQTGGSDAFDAVCAQYGLDKSTLYFPLVIVEGKVALGMEAIGSNLLEMFLTAGETNALPPAQRALVAGAADTSEPLFAGFAQAYGVAPGDSALIYFYRITCEECQQTAPVIDGLPAEITMEGKTRPLRVIRLNTRAGALNGPRIRELFKRYNVPEQDQMVPIVFLADTYLAGYEQISAHLLSSLEQGKGLDLEETLKTL